MICESGKVVSIDDKQQLAWVETFQTSSCQACSAKSGCGTKVLNSLFSGRRHYVKVSTKDFTDNIQLHDTVEIAISEHIMLTGSLWVYLLPLFSMISMTFLANHFIPNNEPMSILGALAGLIIACGLIRLHSLKHQSDPSYHPVLNKVLTSQQAHSTQAIQVQAS